MPHRCVYLVRLLLFCLFLFRLLLVCLLLPLRTFSGKLRTFPMVKSKTIGFLLDLTQQYTPVLFTKTPCELLPEKELLSGHYAACSEVACT